MDLRDPKGASGHNSDVEPQRPSIREVSASDNAELFLLAGLVAHLAYNVDVEDGFQTAVDSLDRAHKLAPDDYRPQWFIGIHRCQANQIKDGMEQLLAIEDHIPWKQLPVEF